MSCLHIPRSAPRGLLAGWGLVGVMLVASPAWAEAGELSLGTSARFNRWMPEGSTATRWEPGLVIDGAWWVDDFWSVALRLGGGAVLWGGEATTAGAAQLEVRYVLDALTWVPWGCAGVGGRFVGDGGFGGPERQMTGHGGVGLDYRPSRRWSVGFEVRFHKTMIPWQAITGPLEVGLAGRVYLD